MAFNTSISGLQAAQKDMGVISNNIANVGTAGFKRSDALFAELYSASLNGTGPQPGSGVTLEAIRNDFGQGGFEFTSSQLDLAIDGNGLFVLQNGAETLYTRAGAFRLDGDGFVVTESGANLQGYGADDSGQITTALGNLQITNALLAQKPTEEMYLTATSTHVQRRPRSCPLMRQIQIPTTLLQPLPFTTRLVPRTR